MFFRVTTTHYGPKDSETGLHSIVSAPSEEVFWGHLKSTFHLGNDEDDASEEEDEEEEELPETSFDSPDTETLKRAARFNVIVENSWRDRHSFRGRTNDLIRTLQGNYFEEIENARYGVTQFEWCEIDGDLDVETLKAALGDRFVEVDE